MAIPFPAAVVEAALQRSGHRCECIRSDHPHYSPCGRPLSPSRRGADSPGGWEALHVNPNGAPTLANCEVLCITCYRAAVAARTGERRLG